MNVNYIYPWLPCYKLKWKVEKYLCLCKSSNNDQVQWHNCNHSIWEAEAGEY